MNVASLSLCYPSKGAPFAGLFVQRRLAALATMANVRVIRPVPAVPWRRRALDEFAPAAGPPETHSVTMPYMPWLSRPINHRLYARAVMPVLVKWRRRGWVDIMDAHFSWPDGVAAWRLSADTAIPYAVTLRGVLGRYLGHPLKRKAIVAALQHANAVIAVSQNLAEQALRVGVPAKRLHVIRNGVDRSVFHAADKASARRGVHTPLGANLVVSVGHLCPRKGFQRVIRILPALLKTRPDLRYVIIGDDGGEGRYRRHLAGLIKSTGLDRHVSLVGRLAPSDVAKWLQAADLFVLPSRNEGCCNALCEAVAAGVPVVCSNVGGNAEIVGARRVVPLDEDRVLLSAMQRALGTPDDWVAHGASIPSWADVARRTHTVLNEALERTRRLCNSARTVSSPARKVPQCTSMRGRKVFVK